MAEKYVKLNDIIDTLENEWGYEGMREDLEKLPTADVVEVVRCKDCRKNGTEYCIYDPTVAKDENDYCSYGERSDT